MSSTKCVRIIACPLNQNSLHQRLYGVRVVVFFSSGLSLGRIDALGRFEADFEPEPEARRESRLSRLARRLKRQPQDQEELAWRVAEMIVRDVTSITLAPQPPEHPPSTGGS